VVVVVADLAAGGVVTPVAAEVLAGAAVAQPLEVEPAPVEAESALAE
jgi:hypothetical protein